MATVFNFGNGETKVFASSLSVEQGVENDCKEVSHVWIFHFLLGKTPWGNYDLMNEGLSNHASSYGTICRWLNAIHDW
jgi:hypothetical protein